MSADSTADSVGPRHQFHIHVIDDDASFRVAIGRLLGALGYSLSLYASAQAFLDAPDWRQPGCILLDVKMPGINGLQLQEQLLRREHGMPVVFLTGHGDVAMSVRAVKAGAEDFLLKPVSRATLLDAIDRCRVLVDQQQNKRDELDVLRMRLNSLTPREREVFGLVVQGLLNKQIAHQLGNTERTVKAQRSAVMDKMQASSLAELVLVAARLGIVAP